MQKVHRVKSACPQQIKQHTASGDHGDHSDPVCSLGVAGVVGACAEGRADEGEGDLLVISGRRGMQRDSPGDQRIKQTTRGMSRTAVRMRLISGL